MRTQLRLIRRGQHNRGGRRAYDSVQSLRVRVVADEEARRASRRWLYVDGPPGSGKSALILEAALRAAKEGMQVLIVCPTGNLVHSFKSMLPEQDCAACPLSVS